MLSADYETNKESYEASCAKVNVRPKKPTDFKKVIINEKICYLDSNSLSQGIVDGQVDQQVSRSTLENAGKKVEMDGYVRVELPDGPGNADQGDLNLLRNRDSAGFEKLVITPEQYNNTEDAKLKYVPIKVDGKEAYWPLGAKISS